MYRRERFTSFGVQLNVFTFSVGEQNIFMQWGGFDLESQFFIWHMIKVNEMSPAHESILCSIWFLMLTKLIACLAPLKGRDQHPS